MAIYEARSCNQTYRFALTNPARVAEANQFLASGAMMFVEGTIQSGDGGFNAPWGWHFGPSSVEFGLAVIMVLLPCPSEIDADPTPWIGTRIPQSGPILARIQ
jgi:hypothetical protein